MIDLELPGVGVRLGVHQDALLRRPRRDASGFTLPTSCSAAALPPSGTPSSGSSSPRRRRLLSSSSSASSIYREPPGSPQQHQQPNVLRLSLRKPGDWQWQLRTSASSPALVIPAVQLYDHRGRLLVDTSSLPPSTTSSRNRLTVSH
ncbi:uncharacterized protein LOC117645854 [Thrips palmi]|uniref:Uncharacterized protein LOC117645854 n=1 Tax=Thrips palmi TaxID=161013 RepID=A0A6P8YQH3_THRPL|nr:uncharacterized protein LOC117645854 [Thrips palmi]